MIGGRNKYNSVLVGFDNDKGDNNSLQRGGVIRGSGYAEMEVIKNQSVGQNLNVNREGKCVTDHGLIVIDPKRRRVDGPEKDGLDLEQGNIYEDVPMLENKQNETQDPKN